MYPPVPGFKYLVILSGIAGLPAQPLWAQDFSGAFEGLQNPDQPIQITSNRMEVRDNQGTALFTGNVEVIQGSTILNAKRMKVIYSRTGNSPDGNLKSIEVSGKIAVRSGENRVTADQGNFDMRNRKVKLTGDVFVTQGSNIANGCVLEVNLKTNSAVLQPCGNDRPTIVLNPKNAN